jgi:mono/diheme cytochrome c family protein
MKTFLLLVSLALASQAFGAAPDPNDVTARLYRAKCAGCHGADGAGGVGASLKGPLHHRSSAQLFEVIKNGIPGTEMPASGLPDPQVKKMVTYVLSLGKKKP